MRYRLYLEPDEDGVFVATCPTLPGCVSQGRTRTEAAENIREAIEGYLKSLKKHGDPVPPGILEEVIEAGEVAGGFWQRRGQGIPKEELANLRALIREAGFTVEESTLLL